MVQLVRARVRDGGRHPQVAGGAARGRVREVVVLIFGAWSGSH
jgi:hypothetical protein